MIKTSETEKNSSIEKILLDSENRLLLDSSLSGTSYFCEEIFPARSYSHLNKSHIQKEILENFSFLRVLKHHSSLTLNAITKELEKYNKIIKEKKEKLDEDYFKRIKKTRFFKKTDSQKLFNQLYSLCNEICFHSRTSEFKENSHLPIFDFLKQLRDLEFKDLNKNISDTDLELASLLYYNSNQEPTSLFTADHDFLKIAYTATETLRDKGYLIPDFKIYFKAPNKHIYSYEFNESPANPLPNVLCLDREV